MESNKENSQRPDGWPRWLWSLVILFVRPQYRFELMNPSLRAKNARAIAEKLIQTQKDMNEWRNRAFSAERCFDYELKMAIKQSCERHNKEHGTVLGWY